MYIRDRHVMLVCPITGCDQTTDAVVVLVYAVKTAVWSALPSAELIRMQTVSRADPTSALPVIPSVKTLPPGEFKFGNKMSRVCRSVPLGFG